METQNEQKPAKTKINFWKRLFTKIDDSMKVKAIEQSQKSRCCGDDKKGGKCC